MFGGLWRNCIHSDRKVAGKQNCEDDAQMRTEMYTATTLKLRGWRKNAYGDVHPDRNTKYSIINILSV